MPVTNIYICESVEGLLNCLYVEIQVTEKYWTMLTIKEWSTQCWNTVITKIPTVEEVSLLFNNCSITQNHQHGVYWGNFILHLFSFVLAFLTYTAKLYGRIQEFNYKSS